MRFTKIFALAFMILQASSTVASAQALGSSMSSDSLTTNTIKVKCITCSTDVKMISANVEKLNGVSSCKAGKLGPTATFEVRLNSALVTEKELFAAIEDTGGAAKTRRNGLVA